MKTVIEYTRNGSNGGVHLRGLGNVISFPGIWLNGGEFIFLRHSDDDCCMICRQVKFTHCRRNYPIVVLSASSSFPYHHQPLLFLSFFLMLVVSVAIKKFHCRQQRSWIKRKNSKETAAEEKEETLGGGKKRKWISLEQRRSGEFRVFVFIEIANFRVEGMSGQLKVIPTFYSVVSSSSWSFLLSILFVMLVLLLLLCLN